MRRLFIIINFLFIFWIFRLIEAISCSYFISFYSYSFNSIYRFFNSLSDSTFMGFKYFRLSRIDITNSYNLRFIMYSEAFLVFDANKNKQVLLFFMKRFSNFISLTVLFLCAVTIERVRKSPNYLDNASMFWFVLSCSFFFIRYFGIPIFRHSDT